MSNNNFNSRFRLFLESIEEEELIEEAMADLDFNTIGRGTASSTELATDARNAASGNVFSGKEWSPQEKAILRRSTQMFQYMIENGDIVRIVPDLKIFFQRCFDKLGIKPPAPQNTDQSKTGGSLTVGGKPLR